MVWSIIAFCSNLKTTSTHPPSQVEWNYWFYMQTTNGNPQGTNSRRKIPSRESITLFSRTNFQEWKSLNVCMYECRPYSSGKPSLVDTSFITLSPIFYIHKTFSLLPSPFSHLPSTEILSIEEVFSTMESFWGYPDNLKTIPFSQGDYTDYSRMVCMMNGWSPSQSLRLIKIITKTHYPSFHHF